MSPISPERQQRHSFRVFEEVFASSPVISVAEVSLHFPGMRPERLSQWQAKGYIRKIRNGFYRMASRPMNDHERWAIANSIHAPSYISLRSALGYYNFIPEGVFHVESVTTGHTKRFAFNGTQYTYRHIKPAFHFGYRFLEHQGLRVRMASPEKALLDVLYLHPEMATTSDFEAWRLDATEIVARIDAARMDDFAGIGGSDAMRSRYHSLKKWLHDHA
jgi:predicted transcriptional regulator of viral defense system